MTPDGFFRWAALDEQPLAITDALEWINCWQSHQTHKSSNFDVYLLHEANWLMVAAQATKANVAICAFSLRSADFAGQAPVLREFTPRAIGNADADDLLGIGDDELIAFCEGVGIECD